uniref:Uncharacterized protein n=1 Tax=Meloidogyne hapla TaxID=6305 RepID=A0A1I8AYD1_MELHA
MTLIKTNDKLIVLQFLIQYNKTKTTKLKQKIFKTTLKLLFGNNNNLLENNLQFNFICLFPSQINIILAVKQAQILINILQQQIIE